MTQQLTFCPGHDDGDYDGAHDGDGEDDEGGAAGGVTAGAQRHGDAAADGPPRRHQQRLEHEGHGHAGGPGARQTRLPRARGGQLTRDTCETRDTRDTRDTRETRNICGQGSTLECGAAGGHYNPRRLTHGDKISQVG